MKRRLRSSPAPSLENQERRPQRRLVVHRAVELVKAVDTLFVQLQALRKQIQLNASNCAHKSRASIKPSHASKLSLTKRLSSPKPSPKRNQNQPHPHRFRKSWISGPMTSPSNRAKRIATDSS